MSDKELALEACVEAFKGRIEKTVHVLLEGWITAKTPADQQKLLERFEKGLALHKEAYASAQETIKKVFK